jgi:hypothetical protein
VINRYIDLKKLIRYLKKYLIENKIKIYNNNKNKKNMKKLLILFSMLMITLTSFSQIDASLGITNFSLDTKLSSNNGINVGLTIKHLYLDFSSNMAKGSGSYLDFSSQSTYNSDKVRSSIINIGYNIFPLKIWSITPIVGYGYTNDIYEDQISWDTYFYGKAKSHINFGIVTKIYIKDIGIFVGKGTLEDFKIGLSYKFF